MPQILIVDDDEAMREVIRMHFEGEYSVIDTGDPEHAFAIALEQKPDAILLDLSMAKVSGFELCKMLSSFSLTRNIPIFIITGGDSRNEAFCKKLGACSFFQKPIDFDRLHTQLQLQCASKKSERRADVRIQLKVILKLKGQDSHGMPFEVRTCTEDISANGFQSGCSAELREGSTVEVMVCNGAEDYVGTARVVRTDRTDPFHPRYGFRLQDQTDQWFFHGDGKSSATRGCARN